MNLLFLSLFLSLSLVPDVGRRSFLVRVCVPSPVPPPSSAVCSAVWCALEAAKSCMSGF